MKAKERYGLSPHTHQGGESSCTKCLARHVMEKERFMAKPKKPRHETITEKQEEAAATVDAVLAAAAATPEVGDIVQNTERPHPFLARIGIVHEVAGDNLICYNPGKDGFPHRFITSARFVTVVGRAKLKWSKPLPPQETKKRDMDKV